MHAEGSRAWLDGVIGDDQCARHSSSCSVLPVPQSGAICARLRVGARRKRRNLAKPPGDFDRPGTKIRAVLSLTAIVPATNDPPTLTICTDAIEVAEDGSRAADRRSGCRPAGSCRRPERRRARSVGRRARVRRCRHRDPSRRIRPDTSRLRRRSRPRCSLRLVRRPSPGGRTRLRLQKPAPPPCPPILGRPCNDILGRHRRGPPRRVRARRRLRPGALRACRRSRTSSLA